MNYFFFFLATSSFYCFLYVYDSVILNNEFGGKNLVQDCNNLNVIIWIRIPIGIPNPIGFLKNIRNRNPSRIAPKMEESKNPNWNPNPKH